jgi:hypothetical protein
LAAVVLAFGLSAGGPALAVRAASYEYDAPIIARVDVHELDDAPASPAQLGDVREGSVSTSVND